MSNSALVLFPINQLKKKIDLLSGPTDALEILLTTPWTGTTLEAWLSVDQNRNDWEHLWAMPNTGLALANNAVLMAAMYSDGKSVDTLYSSIPAWTTILSSKVARDAITAGTAMSIIPWVRPADWLALPELTDADKKFVGLFGVEDSEGNYLALTAAGNYTVDWGDGVIENYAANIQANHTYNYAAISNSTLSTEGYKQVIVTVTPQAGQLFTLINIQKYTTTVVAYGYNTLWLDISVAGTDLTSVILSLSSQQVSTNQLQQVKLYANNVTDFSNFFNNARCLKNVVINTDKAVNMSSMFSYCYSLQSVPLFNTANVTAMSNMFSYCTLLQSVPLFNTAKVAVVNAMFLNCTSLQSVPLFNTGLVTNMLNMFYSCTSLQSVPLFNTSSATTMSSMFNNCHALRDVPLFNTSSATTLSDMFTNCYALRSVPLFNTSSAATLSYMFSNCRTLQTVPLFNTANVTNMSNMFYFCYSLQSVPLFNTANVTNMSNMFYGGNSLIAVPLFNTANVTNMSTMFQNCYSLRSVPLFNTAKAVDLSNWFFNCTALEQVPLFDTASATTLRYAFAYCYSLRSVTLLNTSSLVTASNIFMEARSLQSVTISNLNNVSDLSLMFYYCYSLSSVLVNNIRYTVSFSNGKLSKNALETIFTNLGTANGTQSITVTSNPGRDAAINKTGTLTLDSLTVAIADTSSLEVGMFVGGVGVSSAVAVTLQDATDTVFKTNHRLLNGTPVSFSTLVSTTGIVVYKTYFVVNATTDTFQLALVANGAPMVLTTNGSGTILYGTYITDISINSSITLSVPASLGGSQGLMFRRLNTSIAVLKGWTVVI